jgi:hypothetical protein
VEEGQPEEDGQEEQGDAEGDGRDAGEAGGGEEAARGEGDDVPDAVPDDQLLLPGLHILTAVLESVQIEAGQLACARESDKCYRFS